MVSTVKSLSACLVLNLKNQRLPLEILNTLLNGKVFRFKKKETHSTAPTTTILNKN